MADPAIVVPLILGLFGAIVGSFLNVVIYRLPREDLSIFRPRRSFCPGCRRQIPWQENIPVVSWILLGGRCRGCRQSIPARYVIVEGLTAILFGALGVGFVDVAPFGPEALVVALAGLLLAVLCVVTTFIDLDFKIIPDEITWPGMALGVILSVAAPRLHAESHLFGVVAEGWGWERHAAAAVSSLAGLAMGVLVVFAVGWLGSLVFRKEAMGLGDVKFMGMVGAFLGYDGVLLVFFLGCLTGAVGGLIHRALTGDRYIAFGPYLSLGVLLTLFFRVELVEFFLVRWPEMLQGALRSGG